MSSGTAQAQRALTAAGLDPTPMSYSLFFCINGSYTAGMLSIPTIGFGVGEEHIAHQANEYVTLSSLRRGAKGLSALSAELIAPAS
jgi:acetylornithine deacetylase/succinyl-diaminopimelate desuccinylase-like protein